MSRGERSQVALVLFCHFTAALAALGMPPFFGVILAQSLDVNAAYLIGWFYVVPTVCTALASPWWGRFADRWGKGVSLLRAQLGLALGFVLASLANNPWFFLLALVVQGTFGGTFAASNAYLGSLVRGSALARSLNLMQGSARAAMVIAPILFGFLITRTDPLSLYGYLAALPLLAALVLGLMPSLPMTENVNPGIDDNAAMSTQSTNRTAEQSVRQGLLFGLQFSFAFCTVITFPYFVPYAQQAGLSVQWAGVLFSLPHLVYLLLIWPLGRQAESSSALRILVWGFVILALSLIAQALSAAWPILIAGRLTMGVAMTLCFIGLHRLMSRAVRPHRSGRLFGSLDSVSKWAGVAAGLVAGLVSAPLGFAASFWVGAAGALLTLALMYVRHPASSPTSTLAKE